MIYPVRCTTFRFGNEITWLPPFKSFFQLTDSLRLGRLYQILIDEGSLT